MTGRTLGAGLAAALALAATAAAPVHALTYPERVVRIISPYPPGVPVVLPGEVLTQPVIDYLRGGLAAHMYLPDTTDPELETFRVLAR